MFLTNYTNNKCNEYSLSLFALTLLRPQEKETLKSINLPAFIEQASNTSYAGIRQRNHKFKV